MHGITKHEIKKKKEKKGKEGGPPKKRKRGRDVLAKLQRKERSLVGCNLEITVSGSYGEYRASGNMPTHDSSSLEQK